MERGELGKVGLALYFIWFLSGGTKSNQGAVWPNAQPTDCLEVLRFEVCEETNSIFFLEFKLTHSLNEPHHPYCTYKNIYLLEIQSLKTENTNSLF